MSDLYKLEVHFDFVEVGQDIEVGALVIDDGEVVHSKLEAYRGSVGKGNNYHYSLMGWSCGFKAVKEFLDDEGDVFDGIVFLNQNQQIFKWAETEKFPKAYNSRMEKVYEQVKQLVSDYELTFTYTKIPGKDNQAKKMMKKRKEKKEKNMEQTMTFGNVLKQGKAEREQKEKREKDRENVVSLFDQKEA